MEGSSVEFMERRLRLESHVHAVVRSLHKEAWLAVSHMSKEESMQVMSRQNSNNS